MGIFSSLFSSKKEDATADKEKDGQKNFDILKYDGIRAMQIHQIDYAIRCFSEALRIQSDFETMNYLANAYTMQHETESALEVVNEMLELEPDHVNTLLMRVNLLFLSDRDTDVLADTAHVIELDPENYLAYFMQAKGKRTAADQIGAIADLTRALAIKEDFADAYLLRSEILLSMQQGNEALVDAEEVIRLVPEEETAYLLRGRIHELLKDTEAALKDYQEALELNPFNENAYLLYGNLLLAEKRYDEAIAVYDEAIEHNEQFAKAYAERGRAKNEKGDKEGALSDLKTSIELNPEGEEAGKLGQANFDDMYKGGIF